MRVGLVSVKPWRSSSWVLPRTAFVAVVILFWFLVERWRLDLTLRFSGGVDLPLTQSRSLFIYKKFSFSNMIVLYLKFRLYGDAINIEVAFFC